MQISDRKNEGCDQQVKNISMDVKTGQKELEETIDVIAHCRANWVKMEVKSQKLATGKGTCLLYTSVF